MAERIPNYQMMERVVIPEGAEVVTNGIGGLNYYKDGWGVARHEMGEVLIVFEDTVNNLTFWGPGSQYYGFSEVQILVQQDMLQQEVEQALFEFSGRAALVREIVG